MKLSRLGTIPKSSVGRQLIANVPRFAGSRDVDHIQGFNPRKERYTEMPGTNPATDLKLGSSTAPYKHDPVVGGKFKL